MGLTTNLIRSSICGKEGRMMRMIQRATAAFLLDVYSHDDGFSKWSAPRRGHFYDGFTDFCGEFFSKSWIGLRPDCSLYSRWSSQSWFSER